MSDPNNLPAETTGSSDLKTLHERVNAMLDIPVPKESDAFPMPVEVMLSEHPKQCD